MLGTRGFRTTEMHDLVRRREGPGVLVFIVQVIVAQRLNVLVVVGIHHKTDGHFILARFTNVRLGGDIVPIGRRNLCHNTWGNRLCSCPFYDSHHVLHLIMVLQQRPVTLANLVVFVLCCQISHHLVVPSLNSN